MENKAKRKTRKEERKWEKNAETKENKQKNDNTGERAAKLLIHSLTAALKTHPLTFTRFGWKERERLVQPQPQHGAADLQLHPIGLDQLGQAGKESRKEVSYQ